jgi:hypothetical protein
MRSMQSNHSYEKLSGLIFLLDYIQIQLLFVSFAFFLFSLCPIIALSRTIVNTLFYFFSTSWELNYPGCEKAHRQSK